jgi:2-polyprenyl-3-methyl-5-hydroxy-6-metoxy-1,4-benzoquinol methylase
VPVWQAQDTETVRCCVCDRVGEPVYRLDPFGVGRCPQCSLVFVSPRLRPDALQRFYDDVGYFEGGVYGSSSRWSPAMVLQRQWTAGRLRLADAALGRPPRGARMLEIGCGYGLFLAAARERGYEVSGVELSHPAAEHARTQLALDVFCGQLTDAPITERFDVICAWDTIEHVPDPVEFWRSVRSLLADDGVALFSTPYFSSLPSRLLRERWWTLKPAEHIWHFTPRTHVSTAAAAGMDVVRTVVNPLAPANFGRLDSLVGVARRGAEPRP